MPIQPICSHLAEKWRSRGWPDTPDSHWYYGGKFQGRLRGWHTFHVVVGIVYLVTCLLPLLHFGWHIVFGKDHTAQATVHWLLVGRWWIGLPWLFITSVGLPLFVWTENLGFSTWLASAKLSQRKKIKLKERFDLNSKHMEATWKSVAGLYLVGGLLSFSNLGGGNDGAKVQALANATTTLLLADKFAGLEPQAPETQKAIEALKKAVAKMTESLAKNEPETGTEDAKTPVPTTKTKPAAASHEDTPGHDPQDTQASPAARPDPKAE